MQLPGRLAMTTLGDLLGKLNRGRASGALELAAAGRRHRVQFNRGLVAGLMLDFQPMPAPIGEVMVGEGFAVVGDVAHMLSRKQRSGDSAPLFGEMLVRAGVVSSALRDAALQRQARARLDALFHHLETRDAEVRFHVGIAAGRWAVEHQITPLIEKEFLHGRRRARTRSSGEGPGGPGSSTSTPSARSSTRMGAAQREALRLFGLPIGATERDIRRAFRAAAVTVHPDRHAFVSAEERLRLQSDFAELSAAYHLLCG
ncbi:MAG: hypothetical protein NVSMB1_10020 [Polyangiales bacterium]